MDSKFKAQLERFDGVIQTAKPLVAKAGEVLDVVGPYVAKAYAKSKELYGEAGHYHAEIKIALGFFFLFFGGNVIFTMVAVEAFMLIGFERTKQSLLSLYESFNIARAALAKDDDVDVAEDKPKPESSAAPSSPSLANLPSILKGTEKVTQRISKLAKVLDPERVTEGLAGVSTGVIAVIGSLQSSLARCLTIGASISDLVLKHYKENFVQFAVRALPQEYHKWIDPGFSYGSKMLGFWVAYFIQRWLLIYSTALRGTDLLLSGLHEKQYISEEQFHILSKITPIVASVGFLKQIFYGYQMMLIFRLVIFPVFVLEWLLSLIAVLV